MKKWVRIVLIVEVQLILGILIYLITDLITLNKRVYDTNTFLFEIITDKKSQELNVIREDDIVIGKADAPVNVFIYSRYECSGCETFFTEYFSEFKNRILDPGIGKLIIRHLAHKKTPKIFYKTQCALFANKHGKYEEFIEKYYKLEEKDTESVKKLVSEITNDPQGLDAFLTNEEEADKIQKRTDQIGKAGIRLTPTFFINDRKIIGYRGIDWVEKAVLDEFGNSTCE